VKKTTRTSGGNNLTAAADRVAVTDKVVLLQLQKSGRLELGAGWKWAPSEGQPLSCDVV